MYLVALDSFTLLPISRGGHGPSGCSRGGHGHGRGQSRECESIKGTEVGKTKTGGKSAKKKPIDGNPDWKSVSADTEFVNS